MIKNHTETIDGIEDDYVLFPEKGPIVKVNKVILNGEEIQYKRFIEDIIYLNQNVSGEVFIDYDYKVERD